MKDGFVKVGAVSPSLTVGNVKANLESMLKSAEKASLLGVKVLVFPEMSFTGYTCQDLFLQDDLLTASSSALQEYASRTKEGDMLSIVSIPLCVTGKLYNTAAAVSGGKVLAFIPKRYLPTYGEFYERRWFTPGQEDVSYVDFFGSRVPFGMDVILSCASLPSLRVAVETCEDLWVASPPSTRHALNGATLICNPSCSDEIIGKEEYRRSLVLMQSARLIAAYVYADSFEGESTTDMVFAGHDMIAENGSLLAESFMKQDEILVSEIDTKRLGSERRRTSTFEMRNDGYLYVPFDLKLEETKLTRCFSTHPFVPSDEGERDRRSERIITLQSLGLKKRLSHTKAKCAVIGLSGGLDSTLALLVAANAFDMLKRDRKGIIAITMPCFGTTKRTRSNAEILANALGVTFREVDVTRSVRQHFADIGQSEGDLSVTYENSQARERTQVLMDTANKEGGIVIGTGDLSELALGWATYNGDHMSMYGVNSSVPKTLVRYLVKWFAERGFTEAKDVLYDILATPVSPELLPASGNGEISQRTEDIVGPYELHDFFLYYFVRLGFSPRKIERIANLSFAGAFSKDEIRKWLHVFVRRFFSQQFKRSALPDGPKVGTVTLSPRSDWRMPSDADSTIWNSFEDEIEVGGGEFSLSNLV